MTIPAITSIVPAEGLSIGGNVILITGTGFRVPPEPPSGYLGGAEQITVSVKFQGVAATWAAAASETEIYCRVPAFVASPSLLPLSADVRVANLDDDGNEIAGENVVEEEGYLYKRVDLPEETYLQSVVRELVLLLRRHVTPNVNPSASRSYDEDPTSVERLQANLPTIDLTGPSLIRSDGVRQIAKNAAEEDSTDADMFERRRRPIVVNLEFDVNGWCDSVRQAYSLSDAFMKAMRGFPYLTVGNAEYDLEIPWRQEPSLTTMPNYSDIKGFASQIVVKGVMLDADGDTVVERGWRITDNDGEPELDDMERTD